MKAWNNIMYDWGCGFFSEFPVSGAPSDVAVYNNTIINSDMWGSTWAVTRRDVSSLSTTWFRILWIQLLLPGVLPLTYSATNLSQMRHRLQAALRNKTVTFVGAPNYHLGLADTNAKDQGTNLSADPVLAVVDDIDGSCADRARLGHRRRRAQRRPRR